MRVRADVFVVEEHIGEIHDGAEAQGPVAVDVGQVKAAAVPRDAVQLEVTLRLPQARNLNGSGRQLIELAAFGIAREELPYSVERAAVARVEVQDARRERGGHPSRVDVDRGLVG